MKKEINPLALIGIAALAVIVLIVFGYRAMQPAPYTPSPGVPGVSSGSGPAPGMTQPNQGATTTNDNSYYPSAPAGSTPGKPVNSGH